VSHIPSLYVRTWSEAFTLLMMAKHKEFSHFSTQSFKHIAFCFTILLLYLYFVSFSFTWNNKRKVIEGNFVCCRIIHMMRWCWFALIQREMRCCTLKIVAFLHQNQYVHNTTIRMSGKYRNKCGKGGRAVKIKITFSCFQRYFLYEALVRCNKI
jgi:hypothetical protein